MGIVMFGTTSDLRQVNPYRQKIACKCVLINGRYLIGFYEDCVLRAANCAAHCMRGAQVFRLDQPAGGKLYLRSHGQ